MSFGQSHYFSNPQKVDVFFNEPKLLLGLLDEKVKIKDIAKKFRMLMILLELSDDL